MEDTYAQAVTPECLNRGSSSGLAWIPDTNIRDDGLLEAWDNDCNDRGVDLEIKAN
jgi:hypothetical protein